jgi:hypothetical protein
MLPEQYWLLIFLLHRSLLGPLIHDNVLLSWVISRGVLGGLREVFGDLNEEEAF